MSASLKVTFTKPSPGTPDNAYSMRVEVTEHTEMTDKIFVMQEGVRSLDADPGTFFVKVATLSDLNEFPEDAVEEPEEGETEIPYYRISSIDLVFRDMITLYETKILLQKDINSLVRDVNADVAAGNIEEVEFDGTQTIADIPWDSAEMLG